MSAAWVANGAGGAGRWGVPMTVSAPSRQDAKTPRIFLRNKLAHGAVNCLFDACERRGGGPAQWRPGRYSALVPDVFPTRGLRGRIIAGASIPLNASKFRWSCSALYSFSTLLNPASIANGGRSGLAPHTIWTLTFSPPFTLILHRATALRIAAMQRQPSIPLSALCLIPP